MSLPTPNLDDLRFQRDLVDEARRRIIHYAPEWTEYNLSDPGITLIELFAWMTEQIVYRLNRVPEKNYIKFLELMGMERQPASSARTDLIFWLSVSLPISEDNHDPVIVPQGTEVVSRRIGEEEEVIFTTDRSLRVVPPELTQVRREQDFHKNYLRSLRRGIETFRPFSRKPQEGDTFYLGFGEERDISGHILRLAFQTEPTQAVGVQREDPPWIWECSMGNGAWQRVRPSERLGEKETTGGLNNERGQVVLYLPLEMRPDQVHGRQGYWLRCRIEQERPEQGMYTESPRVKSVAAQALGAQVPATHAVIVEHEVLGRSSGEPNQAYQLEQTPLLALQPGETLEIEENRLDEVVFVPWTYVEDFSNSDRFDRHFTLDTATGQIALGPAVRQPDGTVRQYGRVPESGRGLRFTRYRYGGGVLGNVPENSLQVLTTSLAYVSRVTNPRPASGGRDPENMDEVVARAQREMRAQLRAVTAEDYELLALRADRSVARAKCTMPRGGNGLAPGTMELLVVPAAAESLQGGRLSNLHIDRQFAKMIGDYLDQYRLLTTILRVREPQYVGIQVQARIVPSEYSRSEVVASRVVEQLRAFLSPLPLAQGAEDVGDLVDGDWEGWPFGRDLYVAEIFSLIQRVPGVKHVLDVRLAQRPVFPDQERALEDDSAPPDVEPVLEPVEQNLVRVPSNALICSLDHQITLVELEEADD
ncbi:MAG: putative baseplate assembly protein [Anaerolineae bacterium]|jgi:predicted phage baseplate assembly protein